MCGDESMLRDFSVVGVLLQNRPNYEPTPAASGTAGYDPIETIGSVRGAAAHPTT